MDNIDNSIDGYFYIVYNEVYQHYGVNIFKIGKSKDVIARLNGYTTSYIKPVELNFVSKLCKDHSRAEKVIFQRLDTYRIAKNRDFLKLDQDVAIDIIEQVIDVINGEDYQQHDQNKCELNNKIKHYENIINKCNDKPPVVNRVVEHLKDIVDSVKPKIRNSEVKTLLGIYVEIFDDYLKSENRKDSKYTVIHDAVLYLS